MILLAYALIIFTHELGHACAASALGYRWRLFGRWYTAGVAVEIPGDRMQPRDDFLIAMAGPLASATVAVGTYGHWLDLSIMSAVVAVLNLLPIPGSDGWRAGAASLYVLRFRKEPR